MARVAVVTGGTRGIGEAISKALKAAGYKVAANYAGNDEAAQKFKSATGIPVYKWDVSHFEACGAGLKQVEADLGPIDILINNAGICINATALDTSPEVWERQMTINLDAVFFLSQAVGAHMVKAGRGAMVNLSSFAAVVDVRPQKHIAYSVSKAGVAHLSRVLASEWARSGVRVNAIAPGFVMTDMPLGAGMEMHDIWRKFVPAERFLHPYEVANVIAFLASDASSAITGQLIMADGGITIW